MAKLIFSKAEIQAKTGLTFILSFFVLFVTNSLVVYLANRLFPGDVVLGTYALPLWWALHLSMTKFTVMTTLVIPLVYYHEWQRNENYSPKEWMLAYFIVNTVGIWVISRYASYLGLGISHWWVAILLGVALDWAQGGAMMLVTKMQNRRG